MVDTPTADTPREPDITHINPASGETWFGHPRQLARLFTTEAWERFGYYGMRALLTLYLTKHFVFGDREATGLYGGYTALVYLTPLVGGYLADQYLGSKRAVKFGAIIMALGYLLLCFGGETAKPYATIANQRYAIEVVDQADSEVRYLVDGANKLKIKGNDDGTVSLLAPDGSTARTVEKGGFESGAERSSFYVTIMLLALCMISVGNGFFKPNISTMVGELYAQGDKRRDAGFTIFYMGINLGSLFSQLLCPFLAVAVGWWAGFGLAAIGMLASWTLIQFDGGKLNGYGEPPVRTGPDRALGIYALALLGIPIFYLLFVNLMNAVPPVPGSGIVGYIASLSLMGKLLFGTFLIAVPGILIWSFINGERREFQMMLAAMVLIVFNVVFWTLFEQAGSSLTLFADRNTDLSVFGLFSISAGQTQFFNAFFIVALAPVMSILWTKLAAKGLEPSIPVKFGIALIGVGVGFLFLVWGASMVGPSFKVAIWWLAGLYFIHSFAELCISPVGLSMITKLSIARVVGLMMGVWFLSISVAQYVAGVVAQVASVETVGGQVTNLKVSLDTYAGVFWTIGLVSAGIGVVLLLISPLIKKWMHGVQ
ncbi:POT family proton-dependent oligopeptide transporter [Sphingomonas sp. PP-CE-1A-559]|jgi:POT family proton-dependent oligopeptide transporter|uniref:peptide MFS transporter n=1 Tax=unclassified Sphingomonas TaxID=196159 RepID=UPI0006FEF5D7|nr:MULTISPECIES: peptide MFS transporter [unclassified Sphingomonas]KQM49139.1 amino acid transporter [Sphingomonas sp. Leaf208]RKE47571.1 POT family proton-dependent oligopeptide transporter [Sphingomonas sp. PP-CC-1A-547]TCM07234.1 POT family proton-dependent oligopeptide transporter [Sphingomonas sp. PP-CC-3G-468]TCP91569.1 POT family proton-dependent oligopeptide transporter [Sphingomonas sp. PP-CE-1A-559]